MSRINQDNMYYMDWYRIILILILLIYELTSLRKILLHGVLVYSSVRTLYPLYWKQIIYRYIHLKFLHI